MATNVLGRVNTLHSSHVVVLDRKVLLKTENIRKSARTNSRNEMVLTFDKNRNR